MQTFVPYDDFELCAMTLDNKRLNKQRIESFQILRAITDDTYGWQSHPATNMWRGYVGGLVSYSLAMCREWRLRDGADNTDLEGRIAAFGADNRLPAWWGDERIHESHRSNLYHKEPSWYNQFWINLPELPYFWPTKEGY